ncbi:MAG: sulfite exporter TauE/SafE family protein [Acidimicrobiaceae bacterium]|nr:sulfite exporter TauE/SafE family protein [Acidimicrobiia bacterium]MCY4494684.1 sulfite exporter TauE/SafE family protein [Acidimicrobiaceae bacterium]
MEAIHVVLLLGGGFLAGIINTMAGGGSLLTVPLLVFADVPGNAANGSNRVGVLAGSMSATGTFRRLGVAGWAGIGRILVPTVAGALVGSVLVSQLTDDDFERVFGLVMIPILALSLIRPDPNKLQDRPQWSWWVTTLVFFAVGIYGGSIQAGIGLILIVALTRAGIDIVTTNHIKVIVTFVYTVFALPVFIVNGDVYWLPASVLAAGLAAGAVVGARITVAGGERVVRPVLVVAVVAMSGHLLGLY